MRSLPDEIAPIIDEPVPIEADDHEHIEVSGEDEEDPARMGEHGMIPR